MNNVLQQILLLIEQRLDASGSVRIVPYLQAARMILRSYTP